MSGTTSPQYPIVKPFGNSALGPTDPGGATLPIPVDSQVGIENGRASFDDGFPAATMVDPETMGGIPPYGQDVNGVLLMITAYCVLLQAGQRCTYDTDASTAFTGYAVGATLDSATTPGLVWTNVVDGNTNDPDSNPTGWAANKALHVTVTPTAGTHENVVLPGASDYVYDVDTTAGAVDFGGFIAQRDGQTLYISCTGANLTQILANSGGSTAANRVRAATDLGVITDQTFTIKYFASINRWLAI